MIIIRASGILLHLSSLPAPYGIGTMGRCAREFVDFLVKAGQSYWQILPVCPTSYGDSPYQSFSTFAGNPYFIDLDMLKDEGLLEPSEYVNIDWESVPYKVNYGALYEKRYPLLKIAYKRFMEKEDVEYKSFCEEQSFWLDDYSIFMTVKGLNDGVAWIQWPEPLKKREKEAIEAVCAENKEEIEFWKFLQYYFFKQWKELRGYANENGVSIIGDLPIYVALDSADVWSNPQMFQLDENLEPTFVAGCPPDGFSATGQLWGNPLFRWDKMEEDNFAWWIKRISYACSTYNVLRLDHFRGFESYYAIPYGDEDASGGHWEQGPGIKLFEALEKSSGRLNIIAEDLGFLTEPVKELLAKSGFPGMKVFELGFDSRDANSIEYLPHNFKNNYVAYVGTHDNDTIQGWFRTASPEDVSYAQEYLSMGSLMHGHWHMMKALWATVADLTIVQAQDLFGLGSESRMNVPSTLGTNWCWRAVDGCFDEALAMRLKHFMELYDRVGK